MKQSWLDRNGVLLVIGFVFLIPFTTAMIGQYQLYKEKQKEDGTK
jgi:hypothetical protein